LVCPEYKIYICILVVRKLVVITVNRIQVYGQKDFIKFGFKRIKFGVFIEVFLFDSINFKVFINIQKLQKTYMYFGCP